MAAVTQDDLLREQLRRTGLEADLKQQELDFGNKIMLGGHAVPAGPSAGGAAFAKGGPVSKAHSIKPQTGRRNYAKGGAVERELSPYSNPMGGVKPSDEISASQFATPMSKEMEDMLRRGGQGTQPIGTGSK